MIIGHKKQWELLKKMAIGGRIPQAFLFAGLDSLGKRKVALEFIKLLNCQEKDVKTRPCQVCLPCNLIEKGKHPDVILVEPQKKEIQIAQIRNLQRTLSFRAQISYFKSVIIDEAQTLRPESQNCLLKTLEEPKGRVIFFLISSCPEMLFETIRSRCEILKFYPVNSQEIENHFKLKIPPAQLQKMLTIAEGRPGKIIEFLREPEKLNTWLKKFGEFQKILKWGISERFVFLKTLFENKETQLSLNSFLESFSKYLRLLLLQKLGVKNKPLDSLFLSSQELGDYSSLEIKEMIDSVENLKLLLSFANINPKLALEYLMLVI
jgi:DNA polymerase-3 subunit delta'